MFRKLRKPRILVTSGPTREPIDPVRYLGNRSSGKMGHALAAAARRWGRVVLVSGPVGLKPPRGVRLVRVETAGEMARAVFREARRADIIFQCAAVADYKPVRPAAHKIKKSGRSIVLRLIPTVDILARLGRTKRTIQTLVGFAAETRALERHALKKLRDKKLDWIVANPVGRADSGLESDFNRAILLGRDGTRKILARTTKMRLARQLLRIVVNAARR